MIFESKREAIEYCLKDFILKFTKSFTKEQLINILSKKFYSLDKDLNVASSTTTRFIKYNFPNKPKTTVKLCTYILLKNNLKFCGKCNKVKSTDNFNINSSRSTTGLQSYCVDCEKTYRNNNSSLFCSYTAKHKANKIQATPKWLTIEQLKELDIIYLKCPKGHQVDHIIPLQGKEVCGLHVPWNLQYLTEKENQQKSNKLV